MKHILRYDENITIYRILSKSEHSFRLQRTAQTVNERQWTDMIYKKQHILDTVLAIPKHFPNYFFSPSQTNFNVQYK